MDSYNRELTQTDSDKMQPPDVSLETPIQDSTSVQDSTLVQGLRRLDSSTEMWYVSIVPIGVPVNDYV